MPGDQDLTLERAGLGARLRAARTEAGMSLDEAAARAHVPRRHLAAIEDGDAASLPAATYGTAFVKAYAGALGLDDHAASRTFRRGIERPVLHAVAPIAPAPPVVQHPPGSRARWPWLIAAAVLLLPAGYAIWRSTAPDGVHRDTRVAQPPHSITAPAVPAAAAASVEKSAPAPEPSVSDEPKSDGSAERDAHKDTASQDRRSSHSRTARGNGSSDDAPAATAEPTTPAVDPATNAAPASPIPPPVAAPRAAAPPPSAKRAEAPSPSTTTPHPAAATPAAAPPPRAAAPPPATTPAAPAPALPKPAPPGA